MWCRLLSLSTVWWPVAKNAALILLQPAVLCIPIFSVLGNEPGVYFQRHLSLKSLYPSSPLCACPHFAGNLHSKDVGNMQMLWIVLHVRLQHYHTVYTHHYIIPCLGKAGLFGAYCVVLPSAPDPAHHSKTKRVSSKSYSRWSCHSIHVVHFRY